jgi:hypothetical protein
MDEAKQILTKQLAALFGFEDGCAETLEMLLTIDAKEVSCLLDGGFVQERRHHSFSSFDCVVFMLCSDILGAANLLGTAIRQRQKHPVFN